MVIDKQPFAAAGEGPQPELLSDRQVAALLGCSRRHIWKQTDAGNMPRPVKFGRKTVWIREQLRAWMADGCRPLR